MSQENMEVVRRGMEQFNQDFTSEELHLDYVRATTPKCASIRLDAVGYGHRQPRSARSTASAQWLAFRALDAQRNKHGPVGVRPDVLPAAK
jgi:hypothetical protein